MDLEVEMRLEAHAAYPSIQAVTSRELISQYFLYDGGCNSEGIPEQSPMSADIAYGLLSSLCGTLVNAIR